MSEIVTEKANDRPEARERVQDALVEITALLRKHRLVEGSSTSSSSTRR